VDVAAAYDGLAADYHLLYGDWDAAVERQGAGLDALLRVECGTGPLDILDCACGIGTQALGLAARGHRVVGSDVSAAELARAAAEARARGVTIALVEADFRALDAVGGPFDAVLCCDNALAHALTVEDVEQALSAMRERLRPGGLLVLTLRDYDVALRERPGFASDLLDGPPRRVLTRVHDWDAAGSPVHRARIFLLVEEGETWRATTFASELRAIVRSELERSLAAAGLTGFEERDGEDAGFHQPVFLARRAG
jgi:2-polyprenyl-3-methyl-5-hydroxy-6-metoxy-1,4-benzoquinol methylase